MSSDERRGGVLRRTLLAVPVHVVYAEAEQVTYQLGFLEKLG